MISLTRTRRCVSRRRRECPLLWPYSDRGRTRRNRQLWFTDISLGRRKAFHHAIPTGRRPRPEMTSIDGFSPSLDRQRRGGTDLARLRRSNSLPYYEAPASRRLACDIDGGTPSIIYHANNSDEESSTERAQATRSSSPYIFEGLDTTFYRTPFGRGLLLRPSARRPLATTVTLRRR